MAEEDPSQEKTEEPTPKRLKDTRDKGQTARSRDFNTMLILIFSGVSFVALGPVVGPDLLNLLKKGYSFPIEVIQTQGAMLNYAKHFAFEGLKIISIFFFILIIAIFIGPIIIGGWVISAKAMEFKLSRMSPIKGFGRMFSLKSLVELIKTLLKFLVIASVAVVLWRLQVADFLSLGSYPVTMAIAKGMNMLAWFFLIVACALIIISAIDVPFQLYDFNQQLKMTLQEVKDEYKETEGKPEVKGHIRRVQQEIAQRRMMQEVPKADVILTNPTHFAVALVYDENGTTAPTVIAKGKDEIALQIGKVGKAHEIPILRLPPLARAIYFSTEIEMEIPRGLYMAVAQVLAYVFQLRRRDRLDELEETPRNLADIELPQEYDRFKEEF